MEDKKESRSKKMYKDSPKMERNEHGKMARSKKPEHKKEEMHDGKKGADLAMHHKHSSERMEMHQKHEKEHAGKSHPKHHKAVMELHAKHEKEHNALQTEHMNEDQGDAAVAEQAAEGGQGEA